MDARARDRDVERAPEKHRPARPLAPTPHVSRRLPGAAPGSHLLRGEGRSREAGAAADTAVADGVRPPAADCRIEGAVCCLTLFFVLLFLERQSTSRRTKRFAVIVDRQIAN